MRVKIASVEEVARLSCNDHDQYPGTQNGTGKELLLVFTLNRRSLRVRCAQASAIKIPTQLKRRMSTEINPSERARMPDIASLSLHIQQLEGEYAWWSTVTLWLAGGTA
jgi:hypothetical protein